MDTELRKAEHQMLASPSQSMMERLATALRRSGDASLAEWMQFLSGHWTLTAPTREGAYFTKTRQDEHGGMLIHLYMLQGELVVASSASLRNQTPSERWQAYWWSEPMPNLPTHTSRDDHDAR